MAKTIYSSQETQETRLNLSSNQALILDSAADLWMVQEGKADVYAVSLRDNRPVGRLMHLFRAEMGQTMFGLNTSFGLQTDMGLLATGIPQTTLIRRNRAELLERARERKNLLLAEAATYLVESWVLDLFSGIIQRVPPTRYVSLEPGDEVPAREGDIFRPRGEILWVRQQSGASIVADRKNWTLWAGSDFHPLTGTSWIRAVESGEIECRDTLGLVDLDRPDQETSLWKALDHFHGFVLPCIHQNLMDREIDERERLIKGAEANQAYLSQAFEHLQKALTLEDHFAEETMTDPLIEACRRAGFSLGVKIQSPPGWVTTSSPSPSEVISEVCQSSGIRSRKVELSDRWWKKDNGPLIVFSQGTSAPLAALPVNSTRYRTYDPQSGKEEPLTEERARDLHSEAYMLYRSLPDRPVTLFDLVRFAFQGVPKRDVWMAVLMGVLGGLLGLVLPFITGVLFDQVIPVADKGSLVFLAQFLLISALAVFFFNVVQLLAFLRLESRADFSLQAALWDRLLKLPLSFYQRYLAGDLGNRVNGISLIRQMVSGMTANALFSGFFSLLNFILIFYYIPALARIALVLVLAALLITGVLGRTMARQQQEVAESEGKISGLLLQIFGGISRFRMAGAENRAYYLWAKRFGDQWKKNFRVQTIGNFLTTFSTAFPLLASLVIFLSFFTVAGGAGDGVSTGIFLAFNAAFSGMIASLMALSFQAVVLTQVLPLVKRLKPILEALPEIDETRLDPGEIRGDIEVSRVTFRYHQNDPPVLDDVSLKINTGQFVAIVGPSGSGKSTLFKLLLGFQRPEKGTVYFDAQDLSTLDLRYVRKQMGIVLQNDRLMPGSILQNILGASSLSIDDAWEAAHMAGLAEDIRNMPMGMHTFVTEGGATISGGQQQRLLIARAVVKKPRILLFDEATSALDNQTQSMVTQSLERLKATRLVIAHRLSTIMNADMIYVMDRGRIIQSGSYEQLMAEPGVFRTMAERQLA